MSAVTVLCAPRDEAFAQRIADALSRQGYVPRRPAGAFHEGAIPLNDDAAIVVWSNAALRIARLHQQARQALDRGALVPVAVGGAVPPGEFEALPPVDLSGWGGDEEDPRWRFVLEEIEIVRLRQKQATDFDPMGEGAAAEAFRANGAPDERYSGARRAEPPVESPAPAYDPQTPPVAAPRRPRRRRSRFAPYAAAAACGAALAAVTGAAVFLTPAPDRGSGGAEAETGTLAFAEPGSDAGRPPSDGPPAGEGQSDFEITVTREPEPGSGDPGSATERTVAGDDGETADPHPDETAAGAEGPEPAPTDDPALAQSPTEDSGVTTPDLEALARQAASEDGTQEAAPAVPDAEGMDRLVAEVSGETPEGEEEGDPALAQGDADGYFTDCEICPQMARIPAGSFSMGSPASEPARQDSEGPLLEVAIPQAFALSAREVTFAEWEACVADGGCRGYEPYDHGWGGGDRPAINISYEDAQAYATWLSEKTGATYRLPSEAEWEYAARAGAEGPFAFDGPLTPQKANYDAKYPYVGEPAQARGMTTPAGSFEPNAFGLYDMHGNVWEWTADCWAETLAGAPTDGGPRSAAPGGDCARRALKGGAWNTGGWRLRSGHRIGKNAAAREFDNGFRVARELE